MLFYQLALSVCTILYSIPVRSKKVSIKSSERLWDPASHIFYVCRGFSPPRLRGWGVLRVRMSSAVPHLSQIHWWCVQVHLCLSKPHKRDSVYETGSRRFLYHFADILEAGEAIPRSIISQLRYWPVMKLPDTQQVHVTRFQVFVKIQINPVPLGPEDEGTMLLRNVGNY